MKPSFITFTGADNWTSIESMIQLSAQYPIEWGILFSPKRQGSDNRYPCITQIKEILSTDLNLSAHICGAYSDAIMNNLPVNSLVEPFEYFYKFRRVQINHKNPEVDKIIKLLDIINSGPHSSMPKCIAQTQASTFPEEYKVQWLFDASGGNGISPLSWPTYPNKVVGYAGGLNPSNVVSAITAINATGPYWIDMESGVRTDNKFDINLCRQVCEAVYN